MSYPMVYALHFRSFHLTREADVFINHPQTIGDANNSLAECKRILAQHGINYTIWIAPVTECALCGNTQVEQDFDWFGKCHRCHYWEDMVQYKDEPSTAIIDGCHYSIGSDTTSNKIFKGHGGRMFVIEFNDGRKVVTTDLWTQGSIPEKLRHKFPNNAKFLDAYSQNKPGIQMPDKAGEV